MTADSPFKNLPESEQNRLLRKIAAQLRPMLGEIGEVLVSARKSDNRKPGFIGLLFRHSANKAILFAEPIDQRTRQKRRTSETRNPAHILAVSGSYITAIMQAEKTNGLAQPPSIAMRETESYVKAGFRTFYESEVDSPKFSIAVRAIDLKRNDGSSSGIILYCAFKSGDQDNLDHAVTVRALKLIEQLVRNALSLAISSDSELRISASYLMARLPESFDDYTEPQTLASIYAYVREVVRFPAHATRPPTVKGKKCDPEVKRELAAIHRASTIHIIRKVGGSLKGSDVYGLRITSASRTDGGTTFPAIAKFSTIGEARREADGLRRLQRYFSRIGEMLPPPLEVYLIPKTTRAADNNTEDAAAEDWLKRRCISVTPDLEGRALSDIIENEWIGTRDRVRIFGEIAQKVRTFMDALKRAGVRKTRECPHKRILESRFTLRDSDKWTRSKAAIMRWVGPPAEQKWLMLHGSTPVINPKWWLHAVSDASEQFDCAKCEGLPWRITAPVQATHPVVSHNDLHCGNVLVGNDNDRITILDYDWVCNEYHPRWIEDDAAYFEASFIAQAFAHSELGRTPDFWLQAAAVLPVLAGLEKSPHFVSENNPFARDLIAVIEIIRARVVDENFAASLVGPVMALIRVASRAKIGAENRSKVAALTTYLSLLLARLMKPEAITGDISKWNPFEFPESAEANA